MSGEFFLQTSVYGHKNSCRHLPRKKCENCFEKIEIDHSIFEIYEKDNNFGKMSD